jgi:ABC-type branched-subunit amino acid transport system ATPase component
MKAAVVNSQADGALIQSLAVRGDMAIVVVEQYLDFAREMADHFVIMDRGEVVLAGDDLREETCGAI